MGNSQSTDQESGRMFDPSRDLSDTVIPIPIGGYRSTPELSNHLHDKFFGSTDVREVGSQESLGSLPRLPASPPHQTASPTSLERLLRLGDGKAIDIASLSLVLQEFKNTASPEELLMLRSILSPAGMAGLGPAQSDSGRDFKAFEYRGHVVRQTSYYGPSPGNATRGKVQKLRKQPTQKSPRGSDNHKAKTWSPEDFTASPLSHIASLQSPNAPPPRPTTPSDIECAHLGGLRAGTLRITNGVATPEPSIMSGFTPAMPQPSPGPPDDYFTCSEGTDDGQVSPGRTVTDDQEFVGAVKSSPTTPTRVPRLHTPDLSRKPVERLAVSPIGSQKAVQKFERIASPSVPEPAPQPFALYSQEASSNPFIAVPDDVFDNSSIQNSSPITSPAIKNPEDCPTPESESVYSDTAQTLRPSTSIKRQDAFDRTFDRLTGMSEQGTTKTSPPSPPYQKGSAIGGSKTIGAEEQPPRPIEDADWMSESTLFAPNRSSLRRKPVGERSRQDSTGSKANASLAISIGGIDTFSVPYHDLPVDATPTLPRVRDSSPTPPQAWMQTQSSPLELPSALYPPSRPHAAATEVALKSKSATDLLETPPSSPFKASDGATSLPASAEKGKRVNKLQKKRFSKLNLNAEGPVVVQTQTVPELQDLPSIPAHVAANYSKRMSNFPGMEHLEHTFDSVSVVGVRVDSPERTAQPPEIRFPSPSHESSGSPLSERGRRSKRNSIGAGSSPSRFLQGLAFRGSSNSRKVSDPQELVDGEIMGVQDFGSVARLAGSSPYEIASRAAGRPLSANMTKLSKRRAPETPKKTTVGMDDKTASELAKSRSRDHLANLREASDLPSDKPRDGTGARHERPVRPPMRPLASESVIPPVPSVLQKATKCRPQSYAGPPTAQGSPGLGCRAEHVSPLQEPHGETKGRLSNPLDRVPSAQDATPLHKEVTQAWQAQADFWRRRREEDTDVSFRHDATQALAAPETARAEDAAAAPAANHLASPETRSLQRSASPLASPPRFEVPRLGARSPSPSIKARAAFFEQAAAQASSPRASCSPNRQQAKLQTAATFLSSYDTNGAVEEPQASSGSPVKLKDIMFGANDMDMGRRGRHVGSGGSEDCDPRKRAVGLADVDQGKENEHDFGGRLSDMRSALRATS